MAIVAMKAVGSPFRPACKCPQVQSSVKLAHPKHTAASQIAPTWLQRCTASVITVVPLLLGVALITPPLPALANTENYTIDVRPSEGNPEDEYFQTVPQGLSSEDQGPKGPKLSSYLEGPKGREVQQCTRKCVPTCIRGGQGAPGLGPFSVRKEMVVFKDGYRSRQYCLSEVRHAANIHHSALHPPPPKNQS